jgi:inhibitor of nuclear factor kappa-B kinase subunit alpha
MDEKIFTIEGQYNNQYIKIYAQKSLEVCSEGAGGHHPSHVMVWWVVSHQGVTPLHFCEKGVKNWSRVYQEDVLQGVVKSFKTTVFNGQKWVFQQNSAPAHKIKTTQEWLPGTFQPLSALTPWTKNCGLFWRLAESATTTWTA